MAAKSDDQYLKMTTRPVSGLVITLGIPTTISMLVTNIYNMADTYFVGRLGESASGAVGVVFGLMTILQAVGFTFGHGAGSIISRKLGQKDVESAKIYASVSFFTSLFTGIFLEILGLCFLEPLMRLLGSTDTVLPYAMEYGRYIILVSPLTITGFVMNNILRYEGKAYLAMIGLTVGAVLNIIGDPIFIRELNMGVAGAGLSTALSQCVSFAILLSMYLGNKTQTKLKITLWKRNRREIPIILQTGLPNFVRQGFAGGSAVVLNQLAGNYGDPALAAMAIVGRIAFFIFAVALGIAQGFQPVAGFNYGAKKYSRVKKAFFVTVIGGEIMLGTLALIGLIASGHLVGIFCPGEPEVVKIGTPALRFQLVTLFLHPLIVSATMLFQSVGKNAIASFLSMLRSGLCFIPVILILTYFYGLFGVQCAQAIADALTFLIVVPFVIRFFNNLPKDE